MCYLESVSIIILKDLLVLLLNITCLSIIVCHVQILYAWYFKLTFKSLDDGGAIPKTAGKWYHWVPLDSSSDEDETVTSGGDAVKFKCRTTKRDMPRERKSGL